MSHQDGTNSLALKAHYLATDRLKIVLETMAFQYVIGPGILVMIAVIIG